MNVRVVKRCIERANDFNGDFFARILRIDEKDVDALSAAEIYATQRKTQYIYSPSSYNELGGKKFYTIRRNVSLIEKLPDVQVLPYSAAHKDACLALLKRWGKIHREVHKTKGGLGTSRRAIDLASVLPESVLRGQVVLVDGHLSAFAFGGEIRPGVACSFERKCESALRGLSYFQLRSFLLSFQDYTYVNDGSDAGRTGLRQLKESFRPIMKHVEFRATQHKSALR